MDMDAEMIGHGWKWAQTSEDYYVSYEVTEKLDKIYPVEGELTEEQATRYDELAELAEGEALDENGEAELATLQAILDGGFTDDQKSPSWDFRLCQW